MNQYILAVDQGTSSSRAVLYNHSGQSVAGVQKEFNQYFPKPGWVEHNPMEIWAAQYSAMTEVCTLNGLNGDNVASIGITNQRETTVIWDIETGIPIYNAIVWQDRRTSEYCDLLRKDGLVNMIHKKTGLILDSYFSATKIKWILDNVNGARKKAEEGKLRFGTIDSWLVWKLTGGKVHITDMTNASRTMLFNISTHCWDEDLLKLFDIPKSILPAIKSCSEIYGYTTFLGAIVPLSGIAGDQQSALFGQMCIEPGSIKNTYGTGCFLLMNTGEKLVYSNNSMLSTIALKVGEKITYALEGSVFVGGSIVQWLRDELKIIKSSDEIEALATSVPDNGGVVMVPAMTGLGAPYWDQYARGTIFGLTRGSKAAHIARAALEGIAYQTMDVVNAMIKDSNIKLNQLKVDGGASRNNYMMQFQSDLLNTKVVRPQNIETTSTGVAYLAGLAVGYWEDVKEIKDLWKVEREFTPQATKEEIEKAKNMWKEAIKRTLS